MYFVQSSPLLCFENKFCFWAPIQLDTDKCIVRVRKLVARIPDNGSFDDRLRVVSLSLNSTVLNFNRRA